MSRDGSRDEPKHSPSSGERTASGQVQADSGSRKTTPSPASHSSAPSDFFIEHVDRLSKAAGSGPIVDLACGRGRHTLAGARAGLPMVGIDRDPGSLAELRAVGMAEGLTPDAVRADLEAAPGCPLKAGSCGAIVVFRYLHRPLARSICDALAPGGLLLYETFSTQQIELGWGPSNPAFLLRSGELAELFAELEIIEQWEGTTSGPREEAVGRLLARRATHAK